MYAVKICINTDGDFGYDNSEFKTKDDEERIFYFGNRKNAVNALVRSFHNLRNSFDTDRDYLLYIKEWIDSMDDRVELIAKKIPNFIIGKDFGNQSITYELVECKRVVMDNGCYTYEYSNLDINFSWYKKEEIRWNELEKLPDVEN